MLVWSYLVIACYNPDALWVWKFIVLMGGLSAGAGGVFAFLSAPELWEK